MADRQFQQFQFSLEKYLVRLFCTINVGAAGAVTLQRWNPATRTYSAAPTGNVGLHANGWQGVSTISRVSAGVWLITLQDAYQRLLNVDVIASNATGLPTAFDIGLWTTGTNVASNTAPTIKLTMLNAAGAAADPAAGDVVVLEFVLQNSTAV